MTYLAKQIQIYKLANILEIILSEVVIRKPRDWHAYFCPAEVLDYSDTPPGSKRQAQSLGSG